MQGVAKKKRFTPYHKTTGWSGKCSTVPPELHSQTLCLSIGAVTGPARRGFAPALSGGIRFWLCRAACSTFPNETAALSANGSGGENGVVRIDAFAGWFVLYFLLYPRFQPCQHPAVLLFCNNFLTFCRLTFNILFRYRNRCIALTGISSILLFFIR